MSDPHACIVVSSYDWDGGTGSRKHHWNMSAQSGSIQRRSGEGFSAKWWAVRLPNYYKYEPSPPYCQPPRPYPCHQFNISTRSLTPHKPSLMPSQLRNRTRVTEPTSSSTASSATLEQNQNEPTLGRLGTRRPKRGFGGSSEKSRVSSTCYG